MSRQVKFSETTDRVLLYYSTGKRLPVSVERYGKYPSMRRVRMPDGMLTDMVNKARAQDAALAFSNRWCREPPQAAREARISLIVAKRSIKHLRRGACKSVCSPSCPSSAPAPPRRNVTTATMRTKMSEGFTDYPPEWAGLTHELITDIGNRYEAAICIAMQRSTGGSEQATADRFRELHRGILYAMATELRERGCPEGCIVDCAAVVINSAARRRMASLSPGNSTVH